MIKRTNTKTSLATEKKSITTPTSSSKGNPTNVQQSEAKKSEAVTPKNKNSIIPDKKANKPSIKDLNISNFNDTSLREDSIQLSKNEESLVKNPSDVLFIFNSVE
jgi:hypothetical protein